MICEWVFWLLILPCTRSRRRRGRGDPAGGLAETPTGPWTTSVTPVRQRSSAPTVGRWAGCDSTRPRSSRADDSPGEMDQEVSRGTWERRDMIRYNSVRFVFVRIYSMMTFLIIVDNCIVQCVSNRDLPASWARSCLVGTLERQWRCLLLPWRQSGWSCCYPLPLPLPHCCPPLPPADNLADPTGYGTLLTQTGKKMKLTK